MKLNKIYIILGVLSFVLYLYYNTADKNSQYANLPNYSCMSC